MPDIAHQYRIIATGGGWRRRTERGRLKFSGRDRVSFLQALVTNDVAALEPGAGIYAAYLTPQGRMITDLHIYLRGDHVLADVPAALATRLASTFDQLVFSEDVQVTDESSTLSQFAVCGGAAGSLLSRATGPDPGVMGGLPTAGHSDAAAWFVARTDDTAFESYDVFVPAGDEEALLRAITEAGAVPMSVELAEALRIEAGRPSFGVDMNEDSIPLEAGLLERAISTTKGCYVGQEVVIRVLHRGGGRVVKRLVRLVCDPGVTSTPAVGAAIFSEGHEIGKITSVALSPTSARVIALGYVHRDVAETGRTVEIGRPPQGTATIVGLAG